MFITVMPSIRRVRAAFAGVALATAVSAWPADAQQAPPPRTQAPPRRSVTEPQKPAPIEKLGPDTVRIGYVTVNTARRELSVPGTFIPSTALEFIAVVSGGPKAYESAIELETNGVNFNLGLILIGLDSARSVPPRSHLDPKPPSGDPVEVWIEWDAPSGRQRIRAEQLVYNTVSKETLPEGPWVYTGGTITKTGALLSDVEGPLIGFVHSPAALIDSPRELGKGAYGANRMNPSLNIKPPMPVTVIVRALPRAAK